MSVCRWVTILVLMVFLPLSAAAAVRRAEIVLGMSTALSGPASQLGLRMRAGVELGLRQANSAGGVHGVPLRLICYDDGYEPGRVDDNIHTLIKHDHVLAIIGNVGTPTAIVTLPIIEAARVPFVAPFTGAGLLRKNPPDRYVINYRASYKQEQDAMIDALCDYGGLRPDQIAFFTQRDGYGDAGYAAGVDALCRHGLSRESSVVHVRYERNTLAVENALADMLLAQNDIRAVIMVGTYAPCARFIRLARQYAFTPLFLNVSFVGSEMLQQQLGSAADGVLVTQVVPLLAQHEVPVVREYMAALHRFTPADKANYVGLEGYIAVKMLLKALEPLDPATMDREQVITAFEQLGTFDIGIGEPLYLDARHHQASNHVWVTRLGKGGVEPFCWQQIATMLRESKCR